MKQVMRILKGKDLEPDYFVVTPQQPTGVLLAHNIDQVEAIDDGKWIEITTEDGRKHVVNPNDRLLILF